MNKLKNSRKHLQQTMNMDDYPEFYPETYPEEEIYG